MQATDPELRSFQKWLISRGRDGDTAKLYVRDVRMCAEYEEMTDRLLDTAISPATKRHHLAALRSWARYHKQRAEKDRDKDAKEEADLFLSRLDDLRLPPAERVVEKSPMELDDWDTLIDAIEEAEITEPMRAAVRMIAIRGFRVGDVLRISRAQVRQGIRTGRLIFTAKGKRSIPWKAERFMDSLEVFAEHKRWEHVRDLISPSSRLDRRQDQARKNVYRTIRMIAEQCGLDHSEIYTHRLRRTYAVHYLEASGGNIQQLKDHMSWKSIATASSYVDHARHEELERVADAMFSRRKGRKDGRD